MTLRVKGKGRTNPQVQQVKLPGYAGFSDAWCNCADRRILVVSVPTNAYR